MALDYGLIAPATTPNPIFNFVDESAPGVGDGTPLKASMTMELHTLFMRLIDENDEDYSNVIEQAVPASDDNSQFYRALQKFTRTNAGGFIGNIGISPVVAIPANHLACNGAAISRTTYADLFTAIGTLWGTGDGSTTFNVPDMRGVFLRGTGTHGSLLLANGGAVAGPAVGAYQNDMMQGHLHSGIVHESPSQGTACPLGTDETANATANATSSPITDNTNGTPRTGAETRPFSAGVTFVIRY